MSRLFDRNGLFSVMVAIDFRRSRIISDWIDDDPLTRSSSSSSLSVECRLYIVGELAPEEEAEEDVDREEELWLLLKMRIREKRRDFLAGPEGAAMGAVEQ